MLEPGLIDHIALQVPTGDMTFDEARRTVELFAAEVKPVLEQQFGAGWPRPRIGASSETWLHGPQQRRAA